MALRPLAAALALVLAVALTGCGGSSDGPTTTTAAESTATSAAAGALRAHLARLDDAVARWEAAEDLATAHAAAEEARNLVVGPDGPSWGDADGDGTVAGGDVVQGLLPGLHGEPGAATGATWPCLEADVLGGSWDDARDRWDVLAAAIAAWTPSNNPFPDLPSHPQRVVGWATLALATDDLPTALEYAGHARLHVDVTTDAADECVEG